MNPRPNEHALVDRIGAVFASLVFGVQMLVLAETGHAMPGIPILVALATPFVLLALFGDGRTSDEREHDSGAERDEQYLVASS